MDAKWLRIRPGQELTGNALLLHNGLLRSAHRCFFQGYTAGDCGYAVQPLAVHAGLRENPVPPEPMVAQARLYDSYKYELQSALRTSFYVGDVHSHPAEMQKESGLEEALPSRSRQRSGSSRPRQR